jgi:riboflavin synthase
MFTGIVTDVGTVLSAEQKAELRLSIRCGYDMSTVDLGASIACSGVCLTVVDKGDDWCAVDLSTETLVADRQRPVARGRQAQPRALAAGRRRARRSFRHRPHRLRRRGHRFSPRRGVDPNRSCRAGRAGAAGRGKGVGRARRSVADRQRRGGSDGGGTLFSVNVIPHTAGEHTTLGEVLPGDSSMSKRTCSPAISTGCLAARAQ